MTTIEPFINRIIHGDCIEVMRTMPETSVNLIVTDPPYIVNYRSRDGRRCGDTALLSQWQCMTVLSPLPPLPWCLNRQRGPGRCPRALNRPLSGD